MAQFRVTAPDGAVYEITAPDDATPEQVQQVVAQQVGQPQQEAVQAVGSKLSNALGAIPRQLGLTGRAALTGMGDAVGVLSNPIASAINLGFIGAGKEAPMPNASQTMAGVADWLGLPKPETPTERVAQEGARLMAGTGTFGGLGNTAAKYGTEGAQRVGEFLTRALESQVSAAAGGGLLGGSAKEAGAGPGTQFAASLLGSVAGGMVPGAARSTVDWVTRLASPKLTPQQIDVRIERLLSDQGVDWKALPAGAKSSLRAELAKSLQAGDELEVGATPTRGTVTLDPVQITREKNLSKLAANSGAEELHGLPRIENANNRALISGVNEVGGRPVEAFTAGERARTRKPAVCRGAGRRRAADSARSRGVRAPCERQPREVEQGRVPAGERRKTDRSDPDWQVPVWRTRA